MSTGADHVIVDVIAPSSRPKRKQSNLEAYKKLIRDLGMTAHISDSIFKEGADPFYANTDQFRADDLTNALTDSSTVVWCALGGKGSSRLIPYLEALPTDRKQRIRDARKVFIGYSDITVLHVYLQTVYGWQTIHGTMLELIVTGMVDKRSVDVLAALVDGRLSQVEYELRRITQDNEVSPPQLSLRSKVVGGNLTLIENTVGTMYQLNGAGKIVFLEDIHVAPYALERSLDHLKQTDMFDSAAAIIFGSFVHSEPTDLMALVFRRFQASVPFPVFCIDNIGHSFVNDPLPLNTNATIVSRVTNGHDVSYTLTVDNVYK